MSLLSARRPGSAGSRAQRPWLGRITAVAPALTVAALVAGGGAEAATGGTAQVVSPSNGAPLGAGGSATPFRLQLPADASCTGDTTKDGYRVFSYLVPRAVVPDSLRFDGDGPVEITGELRSEQYEEGTGKSFVNVATANQTRPGGPGEILQPMATFTYGVYTPAAEGFPLPPGEYNVGIACTLGPPSSPTQIDRYWNAVMVVTADPADSPAQIRWAVTSPVGDQTGNPRSPAQAIGVVAGAVAATTAGLFVLRRRRGAHVAGRSRSHYLKETS